VKRLLVPTLLLSVCAISCQASGPTAPEARSLIGFWQMIEDEDGGPLGSVIELRSDHKYVAYAKDCSPYPAMPFHVHAGDVFVSNDIPGKGPVSVLFRPSADGTKLTFTSPRTLNNAVYAFHSTNPCKPPG